MALYQFRCRIAECNHVFDENVPIKEFSTRIVYCPKCKHKANREVVPTSAKTSYTWSMWRK
jgi:putative FmdB family regulatory protein